MKKSELRKIIKEEIQNLIELDHSKIGAAYKKDEDIEIIVGTGYNKYSTITYNTKRGIITSVGSSPKNAINFWGEGKQIQLKDKDKSIILNALKESWNQPDHGLFRGQEDIYDDSQRTLR